MQTIKSIRTLILLAILVFFIGNSAFGQFFSKKDPRFMLAVNENIDWDRSDNSLHHDHLSFAFSVINQKKNHHEISVNHLSSGDNKFFLGLGYQFKWHMMKKFLVNPYLGIYNDVNYRSENLINSEDFPQYEIAWESGIGPGINAHIGRINIDGSFRVPLVEGVFEHGTDPTTPETVYSNWDLSAGTFKDRFAVRLGLGYRF